MKLKTAEEIAVEYFGGTEVEVGEQVFKEFTTLIDSIRLNAIEATVKWAADKCQQEAAQWKMGYGGDIIKVEILESCKKSILTAAQHPEQILKELNAP